MTGIPTSNVLTPGAIANNTGSTQALMSMLQILKPQVYNRFTPIYGDENFFGWLSMYGGMYTVKNKQFDWFEARGKNCLAVSAASAVTVPTAGADVTITLAAGDHFDSGTESPLRVGETVRIASSNVEGKIMSIDDSVAGAFTFVVRPLKSTQKFAGISGGIAAGETIKLAGATDVTEGSSELDSQIALDIKYSNYVTTIRDDWQATDDAQMAEVWYDEGVQGSVQGGVGQAGTSYFTYKALVETEKRFMNQMEEKLMLGGTVTNSGLGTSSGSQGFIDKVLERGQTINYSAGTIDLAKLHEITNAMAVQGCPKEAMWITDLFQKQHISDSLKAAFPAGSFVWGQGEKSEEASIAYGFDKVSIDGYNFRIGKTRTFNTEIKYGKTPTSDYFRNFGVICPLGETADPRSGQKMKSLSVMVQNPVGGGTTGNGIRVWTHGGASLNPTDGTLVGKISMVTYRGTRVTAANQFLTLQG